MSVPDRATIEVVADVREDTPADERLPTIVIVPDRVPSRLIARELLASAMSVHAQELGAGAVEAWLIEAARVAAGIAADPVEAVSPRQLTH